MAAQAAHASLKVILDLMKERSVSYRGIFTANGLPHGFYRDRVLTTNIDSPLEKWLTGLFTKICVSVDSEEKLLEIYNKAKEQNVICSLIQDAGLTEFHGIPTYTCVAIGPDNSEIIDEITGDLKLL